MTKIAFLGLGAMGSRMAGRLLDAGHNLAVWNRSPDAAAALGQLGAHVADSPKAAAEGADIVFSMVRDDTASEAVWLTPGTGAIEGLKPGAIAVEISTVTPAWVARLSHAVAQAGCAFLDTPVAGSRPQAEAGHLIFLVGGAPETLETARPALEAMGGAIHLAGAAGSGAVLKLMVNALFGTQVAQMAELIGFASKSGIDPATAVEIMASTPVCSPAAALAAKAMLAGQWAPAFPIDLVAKDFGLVAQAADQVDAPAPVAASVREVFDHGTRKGFGGDNITGIVQLYQSAF